MTSTQPTVLSGMGSAFNAFGDPNVLRSKQTASSCSVRCPGDLISKTYDLTSAMRDAAVPTTGGRPAPGSDPGQSPRVQTSCQEWDRSCRGTSGRRYATGNLE